MSIGTKKTITIKNKLYGDKSLEVYDQEGLGVGRYCKHWTLFHVASQQVVDMRIVCATRKKAAELRERFLDELPVTWASDDPGLDSTIARQLTDIARRENCRT